MAAPSSILAWEIPWTEEPGGLQSMELQRVGHNWATEHAQKLKKQKRKPQFILKKKKSASQRTVTFLRSEAMEDSGIVHQSLWRLSGWGLVLIDFVGETEGRKWRHGAAPQRHFYHRFQCDCMPGLVKQGAFGWYFNTFGEGNGTPLQYSCLENQ